MNQSQGINCPFKQEPKQPTFKPTCYSCGRVGHTSRVCHAKNHKKPPLLARSMLWRPMNVFRTIISAILTAKVAIPVYSPAKENEKIDELQFVHIKCGNEILKAVIDTDCPEYPWLVNDMLVCSSAYEALLENVQFIHNPQTSTVSSRAVEGITADDRNQFPAKK
ncbi:hypothetical protein TNCV_635471 [Trichonephila clavipes]|nr:hypothetical protein TNCV_635471 [Trichonephila clavipes]